MSRLDEDLTGHPGEQRRRDVIERRLAEPRVPTTCGTCDGAGRVFAGMQEWVICGSCLGRRTT